MSKVLTKLKAKRDALEQRITNHKPLARSVAVNKVRAFATERGLTEDDLFPAPIDPDADFEDEPTPDFEHDSQPDFDERYFPEFSYGDGFGYTFLEELKQWRDELDAEISEIEREAIERARAFIDEYKLTKEDVFPTRDQKG